MRFQFRLVVLGITAPLAAPLPGADVSEVTLRSGDAGVLARNNCISGPLAAAVVVDRHPAWAIIPGTAWLHPDDTLQHSTCAIYEAGFGLPPGYRDPVIEVQVLADNSAEVFLGGNLLGRAEGFEQVTTLDSSSARGFRLKNVVRFEAASDFGAYGIDFEIRVSYTAGDPAGDSDGDEIPDWWELQSGLDPALGADASLDADADGLTNVEEYLAGTDPQSADSDSDGLTDGEEADLGLDPLSDDTDGDGFADGDEVASGSDPRRPGSVPSRTSLAIRSGFDPVVSRPCAGGSFAAVQNVEKIEAWDLLPDTSWVQPPSQLPCATYRVAFALPPGFRKPDLRVLLYADGEATVQINGRTLGRHGGFQHPPSELRCAHAECFVEGENLLEFELSSDGGADGLDFSATVSFVPAVPYRRGDANADGTRNIADPVKILGSLFAGGSLPCQDAADTNDDGSLETSDAVYLLGFLFLGTEAPPEPFAACGDDSTEDGLSCNSFKGCP
jgi:hypothetical protein